MAGRLSGGSFDNRPECRKKSLADIMDSSDTLVPSTACGDSARADFANPHPPIRDPRSR
jgi:hypothetical protein